MYLLIIVKKINYANWGHGTLVFQKKCLGTIFQLFTMPTIVMFVAIITTMFAFSYACDHKTRETCLLYNNMGVIT